VSAVPHPLAAAAASMLYAKGGNAADAAVAAAFALAVVEPHSSGVAGQAHILVRDGGSGSIEAIDAYSVAPRQATADMYRWKPSPTQGDYRFLTADDANMIGHRAVAVPGALLGWCDLHRRYARLPLRDAMRVAIELARDGFAIDRHLAAAIGEQAEKLGRCPASRRLWFGPEGRPLAEGDIVVQEDLARTLDQIADEGSDALYRGSIGRALIAEMGCGGGIITSEDLARGDAEILRVRRPVESGVDGWQLSTPPPPAAGGAAVALILKLIESLAPPLDDDLIVVVVEVLRVALDQRTVLLGRSDAGLCTERQPEQLEQFLSAAHVLDRSREVRRRLEQREAGRGLPSTALRESGIADNEETTHHSHLDSDGNCVVVTQSLGDAFGSGVTVPGSGLLLNNAMKLFDPRPGRPNAIGPFRKMLSSMAPTILTRDDGRLLALGSPSGTRIISAVAQTVVNRLWRGETLADAVVRPRVHLSGDEIEAEGNLPENERAALARWGYDVRYGDSWDDWFGAVQAVERLAGGGLIGAADPRRSAAVVHQHARQAIRQGGG